MSHPGVVLACALCVAVVYGMVRGAEWVWKRMVR